MRLRDALLDRSSAPMRAAPSAGHRRRGDALRRTLASALLGLLALVALVALFAAQLSAAPIASAHASAANTPSHASHVNHVNHALPVRSEPAADAILKTPPTQVKMWFSEALNPLDSRIVVVDPANHEVDARDSSVDMSDPTEMSVELQLLRPGAYVVVWRTQSAVDGHVTGGSYLFRIANADGSVPPVPKTLPSGNVPGAAGFGSSAQAVDGPTLLQALSDWLALLFALFWVGGVIWEVWALPERRAPSPVVALGARLAARRFQRLAPYALAGALLADLGMALALTVQVAGDWSGVFDGRYWQATILSGSFAAYWWMRQVTLLVALGIALLTLRAARRDAASAPTPAELADAETSAADEPIPSWTRAALETLRQTPRLPMRLARGWLDLTPLRQAEVALGALLLFAFAMSGHAAATLPTQRGYAVAVDLAHLIFSAIWLGGLLYISIVLIPAARALPERAQAALLARGAPEFGAIAIVSAAALALTGSLNATVRLTSLAQFATTAYGRTLFVKIELFLVMVAISAFHAFWLRPRLTQALARSARARQTGMPSLRQVASVVAQRASGEIAEGSEASETIEALLTSDSDDANDDAMLAGAQAQAYERAARNGHSMGAGDHASEETRALRGRMEDWLRREALLGVGVLLCVALLALFAGSLAPTQAAVPAPLSAGAFQQTQTASGTAITLQVNPATFGQNTFTVTVMNAQGQPVSGASVLLQTQDLGMDMGIQTLQLQAVGASQPGVYSRQGDLTMAGDWAVTVKVLPPGTKSFLTTQYKLFAGS